MTLKARETNRKKFVARLDDSYKHHFFLNLLRGTDHSYEVVCTTTKNMPIVTGPSRDTCNTPLCDPQSQINTNFLKTSDFEVHRALQMTRKH